MPSRLLSDPLWGQQRPRVPMEYLEPQCMMAWATYERRPISTLFADGLIGF